MSVADETVRDDADAPGDDQLDQTIAESATMLGEPALRIARERLNAAYLRASAIIDGSLSPLAD
jgi:hypothetical protein